MKNIYDRQQPRSSSRILLVKMEQNEIYEVHTKILCSGRISILPNVFLEKFLIYLSDSIL